MTSNLAGPRAESGIAFLRILRALSGARFRRQLRVTAGGSALALALGMSSCSTLPDTRYPPASMFSVVATYALSQGSMTPEIQVPSTATDGEVTVFEIRSDPAPTNERYGDDGSRFWSYPEGTQHVEVRARGRIYGRFLRGAPRFRPLRLLFRGARIETLTDRLPEIPPGGDH